MTTDEKYTSELTRLVQLNIERDVTELHEVLLNCEGADPKIVHDLLLKEIKNTESSPVLTPNLPNPYVYISNNNLPAPNPSLSQWWFSSQSANELVLKIRNIIGKNSKVLCLGTPSLAERLAAHAKVTLLDIDPDVIALFKNLNLPNAKAITYDMNEKLAREMKQHFDLVIVDPPWYEYDIRQMINRALEATKLCGEIFCTLPGRLTRPGIEVFRSALIKDIVSADHNLIAINHDSILYQVPHFEYSALKKLKGFNGTSWRKGDIFRIVKKSNKTIPTGKPVKKHPIKSFARNPKEFRIFLNGKASLPFGLAPETLPNYSDNISTRAYAQAPDVWTTTKVGLKVSDSNIIELILLHWSNYLSKEETIEKLIRKKKIEPDRASKLVNVIEDHCKLWSKYSAPKVLRDPETILKMANLGLSRFAVSKTKRIIQESSDNFRPAFSRDRDRIIWSSSLKRLADKTQLFPSGENDTVRRRLTHTLEVMQLASTIGSSLGLNNSLIEASALAHDLGHTPFGHAGESAIDKLFRIIHSNLGGFNHYEQGLDTVRFIESPYQDDSRKPFQGLNLSPEILEAILKHTYYHSGGDLSSITLQKESKHTKHIPKGFCHLEGQAVRIADKISYLISDIEDGLSIDAISVMDLLDCSLFHRAPLFFINQSRETALNQFLRQRKSLIKILVEDIIHASTIRISQANLVDMNSARNAESYIISYSEEIENDVKEVWAKLQTNLLFKNKNVLTANLLAAKIVSELVILFTLIPDLIDATFKSNHEKLHSGEYLTYYRTKVGRTITLKSEMLNFMPFHLMIGTKYEPYNDINNIQIEHLILAKDYVCSLSDFKARQLHNTLLTTHH